MLMNNNSPTVAAVAQAAAVWPIEVVGKTPDSVKDAGRVRVGAGMLRFTAGNAIDAVKDTGRVRIGAGMLRF